MVGSRRGGSGTKWKGPSRSSHQSGPGKVCSAARPESSGNTGSQEKAICPGGLCPSFLWEGTTGGRMAAVCRMSAELLARWPHHVLQLLALPVAHLFSGRPVRALSRVFWSAALPALRCHARCVLHASLPAMLPFLLLCLQ